MQAASLMQQRLFEPATSLGVTPVPYESGHELLEEHEVDTERELVTTLLDISDITFKDSGQGLRSVHAKSHGLLRGELQVLDLPLPYAQGLFANPRTYPALIRLSTTPGDLLDDKVSTPRGLALKVIGVQGERLPGSPGAVTQDFLLVNGPAFLAPTAHKFLGSLKLLAATTDRVPNLKRAFSALLRGTEKIIEAVGGESGTLKGLGGHPETHILGETFFSQVPFLYGLHMAKWQIAPVSPELLALKDAPVDLAGTPDGLRAAVVEHFATHGGEWELRVQLCTSLESMPIEDATVVWPEEESPFVPVARLTVRPQSAWNETRSVEMDDGLSFSPWHGLAAHRPLGSINRVRQQAYASSSLARSSRGRCPVHEPAVGDVIGAG
ncbi:MAG: catalase family protein [Burkholderiaceae bacterium]